MAYDEQLAAVVREHLEAEPGLREQRMFGGLAFMINGHMAVAASGQGGLLLRVDPADTGSLIEDPAAERFVMRGRPMSGWLHIAIDAAAPEEDFDRWISHGVAYARSLPPKI